MSKGNARLMTDLAFGFHMLNCHLHQQRRIELSGVNNPLVAVSTLLFSVIALIDPNRRLSHNFRTAVRDGIFRSCCR